MQGAQKPRGEAYFQVRRNDEDEAQRGRETFYEAINLARTLFYPQGPFSHIFREYKSDLYSMRPKRLRPFQLRTNRFLLHP